MSFIQTLILECRSAQKATLHPNTKPSPTIHKYVVVMTYSDATVRSQSYQCIIGGVQCSACRVLAVAKATSASVEKARGKIERRVGGARPKVIRVTTTPPPSTKMPKRRVLDHKIISAHRTIASRSQSQTDESKTVKHGETDLIKFVPNEVDQLHHPFPYHHILRRYSVR